MSARQRAGLVSRKKSRHLRGSLRENMNMARLPIGMPLQERWDTRNYYMGHRPGSRIRTPTQRFLQHGRQLSRRNPEQAALRLAPSRNYNNTNMSNILKGREGWSQAENIAHNPLDGHWEVGEYPLANAIPIESSLSLHIPQGPLPESNLYEMWQPVARRAIRPMTSGEMLKEERFRQRAAENAQKRAKALYRSPRSISRSARKVKSLPSRHKNISRKRSY